MESRIEEYTVGELARAAGVSVRMLHHYHAIGLLKPAHILRNGYRIYRRIEALRLQEILFYRAAGMQLREIAELLDCGAPLQRLSAHRNRLVKGLSDHATMIATLDRTISHLTGDDPMMIEDLYKPFSPEKQAEYEHWLTETYGPDMALAVAKAQTDTKGGFVSISEDGVKRLREIETALVANYEAGASPENVDLSEHQSWVAEMWGQPCDAGVYGKLSEVYLAHPDFIARFETLSEGFSHWLAAAMVAWSKRQ